MSGKLLAGWLVLALAACSGGGGDSEDAGSAGPAAPSSLGASIAGLPAALQASFARGAQVMERSFRPSEGLGPFFNATSCIACHEIPVGGGSSPLYRNFVMAANGPEGAQVPAIFSMPSVVVPSYFVDVPNGGVLDQARPTIPNHALLTTAQRNAPPMFGVGLFEFVRDTTIMALANPDGPGVSGRYNTVLGRIGRFGYKSQANNLEAFLRGALTNQMGITTVPVLGSAASVNLSGDALPQVSSDPDFPTLDLDGISDPEMSRDDLEDLLNFSRYLAPPQKKPFGAEETRGEQNFASIGCTECHVPSLASEVGELHAYTDLLIHDMGPELADGISLGVPQVSSNDPFTTGNEFRTQPLWGVSMHAPFLHDGRADTLHEAIIMHGGESTPHRDAYLGLSEAQRADLIAFLEAL